MHVQAVGGLIAELERSGGIHDVGDWVLRTAIARARGWRAARGSPLDVAVNVSPVQVQAGQFMARACTALRHTPRGTGRVELELTESAVMRDLSVLRERLACLSQAGFRLALDDFGCGHSCLGDLAELPVHSVKVDRLLLRGVPEDRRRTAVLASIIAMARELALEVTVEGVERAAQLDYLRRFPDLLVQGHLVAKPMSAAGVERFLVERQPAGAHPRGGLPGTR